MFKLLALSHKIAWEALLFYNRVHVFLFTKTWSFFDAISTVLSKTILTVF